MRERESEVYYPISNPGGEVSRTNGVVDRKRMKRNEIKRGPEVCYLLTEKTMKVEFIGGKDGKTRVCTPYGVVVLYVRAS